MSAYTYRIDPILGEHDDDPATTKLMEDAWLAVHREPWVPLPPQVIGWRLVLLRDGNEVEQREFGDGDEAYAEAQDAGGAWLQQHGGDSLDAFTARAMQVSRRMAWDHGFHHRMSQRGF